MESMMGERLYCARCSRTFRVFEEDPAFADQLCVGCWDQLANGIDPARNSDPPNVNDMCDQCWKANAVREELSIEGKAFFDEWRRTNGITQ